MKPYGAVTADADMDLTYYAMEVAARLLPAAKFYTLTVHPHMAREAAKLLGVHAQTMSENPLSPAIGLVIDETWRDQDEWTLRAGDAVFWSSGA